MVAAGVEPGRVATGAGAEVGDGAAALHPLLGPLGEGGPPARDRGALVAVGLVPRDRVGAHAPHPALDAAHARPRVDRAEGRVGDAPGGTVEELEHRLRVGRRGELDALEGHRGRRGQRRTVEVSAASAELVEGVPDVEGAEDVDVDHAAVGQRQEQLQVRPGHPDDLPAEEPQLALHPERLAHDVGRVRPTAQVGEVGIGVVADHVAVADGTEQAAVADVGVDADLVAQVRDGAGGALGDVAAYVAVGLGEHPGQVAGLVHGERVPVGVAEGQRLGVAAERDRALEVHVRPVVVAEPDARGAVEQVAHHRGPLHPPPVAAAGAVALGQEGPDVLAVEGDHDRVHDRRGHDDVLVGDERWRPS